MVELSVILVSFNDISHLEDCLSSVMKEGERIGLEVIVVDNDSSDGSPDFIQQKFSGVHLIRSPDNLGFSRANNRGFSDSRGEYVLFLNTDTVLQPGAMEGLLSWMKENPDIGAAGPVLFDRKGDVQVSFGGKRRFLSELAGKLFLNAVRRRRIMRMREVKDTEWISAACLLVRRSAFSSIRGFDERFFLYFEDIDLCQRIKREGWRLAVYPGARVFHSGGASTSALPLKSRFFYRKSQIYYYQKHNSWVSRSLLRGFLFINFSFLLMSGWFRRAGDMDIRRDLMRLLGRGSPVG